MSAALLLLPDPTATGVRLAAELAAVLDDVRAALPEVVVSASLAELVAQGQPQVVVLALVPGSAGYDPRILELSLRQQAPTATVTLARALGPHPLLVELAAHRVLDTLDGAEPSDVGVLVVGPGSRDSEANAEVAKVARLLQEGRDFALVEVAYLAETGPDVSAGLARCRALGAERVVVLPHVVVDPGFAAEVAGLVAGWEHITVAGHLDASPELTALIVERYHEARHGDLRMNCDVCAYRELQPHPAGHAHV